MTGPAPILDLLAGRYGSGARERDIAPEADGVVQPICAELAGRLARFDGYGRRFSESLGRVVAGEVEWFTRPMIDSYHTVWFELHEDLLATLGIERAKEGDQT